MIRKGRKPIGSTSGLCLKCGLCCNGVLFGSVKLQTGEDANRFAELGLRIRGRRFAQPCAALAGCSCLIYSQRPDYCRQFECLVFQRVAQGAIDRSKALRLIRKAKAKAREVESILERLGNTDDSLDLSARFRHVAKAVENPVSDPEAVAVFAELTQSFHELNLLLREEFYPG